jgi:histidinol dehydrogenase
MYAKSRKRLQLARSQQNKMEASERWQLWIREVMSEVMTAGMAALQAKLKRDLFEFRTCFREYILKQMDQIKFEINRKIRDAAGRIKRTEKRVGEMEESMADMEQ